MERGKKNVKEIICNGYIFTLVRCEREKYASSFMNNDGWVLKSVIKALVRTNVKRKK